MLEYYPQAHCQNLIYFLCFLTCLPFNGSHTALLSNQGMKIANKLLSHILFIIVYEEALELGNLKGTHELA
jgi:hypothetical protein